MVAKKDTGIVEIHGKEYKTVALRVGELRAEHPDWSITTELLFKDDPVIVMATICNEAGDYIATGHAEEFRGSSRINKTSALENCETSAIGRALAAAGYIGTEFASADEVANAIHQQKHDKPQTIKSKNPPKPEPGPKKEDEKESDSIEDTNNKLIDQGTNAIGEEAFHRRYKRLLRNNFDVDTFGSLGKDQQERFVIMLAEMINQIGGE